MDELLVHSEDRLLQKKTVRNYENFLFKAIAFFFFLLSASFQRLEVKAAENAAKVLSRKAGFKIKINAVSLWQGHKPAVLEPTRNKMAKWKLILPSWPGVAPDEVGGGELPKLGTHRQQALLFLRPEVI